MHSSFLFHAINNGLDMGIVNAFQLGGNMSVDIKPVFFFIPKALHLCMDLGINYNIALKLIRAAKIAGADAVKFQSFTAINLVSIRTPKADYQKQTTNSSESQFDMIKKLELDENAHKELIDYCNEVEALGAGEILLTSMDRDGTKTGFDNDLLKTITSKLSIHVIASGGVGNLEHMYEGVSIGGASALLAASIFHFGEYRICLLYTSPSPRDGLLSRMPSSA